MRDGQVVEIDLPELTHEDCAIKPIAMPLEILFEDDDILVVSKPAGLCVHPAPGHLDDTLVNGVLARHPKMALVGSIRRPGVVHRLDLDTSGAIVFALSPEAYRGLTGQIRVRAMKREYLAVVHGIPSPSSGTINMPIGRDPDNRRKFAVLSAASGATVRHAVTHYDVIERFPHASLLAVRLDTGRTHQIRVHMKRIGHPVCGDITYAPERSGMPISRQALHAQKLSFAHPVTGKLVAVEAPLPADIAGLLEFLRRG